MAFEIRLAVPEDAEALEGLIARSVRRLQADTYSEAQREGALGSVFAVDRQLIADGTYFVVETGGAIAGCGGWSIRRKAHGADEGMDLLDPAVDAAPIRAFFVDPDWARRGVGGLIMAACEAAARAAGFSRLALVATLAGEKLYSRHGFVAEERYDVPLANGEGLPVVRMGKTLLAEGEGGTRAEGVGG